MLEMLFKLIKLCELMGHPSLRQECNLFAIAAAADNLPALQLLLDLGHTGLAANTAAITRSEISEQHPLLTGALYEAVDRGHTDIVRELVELANVDVNDTLHGTTLTALQVCYRAFGLAFLSAT